MPSRRPSPLVSLVAAVARNGAIGKDNDLLWRDREDQRHFRNVTIGRPVLMGRKTWDSLPARFRPLPDRRNIVLTRDASWQADGAERAATVAEAIERAGDAEKLCVIGGAALYALAMPLADELLLTEIDADLDGHVFFPAWDRTRFAESSREHRVDANGVPYSFVTYTRIRPGGD